MKILGFEEIDTDNSVDIYIFGASKSGEMVIPCSLDKLRKEYDWEDKHRICMEAIEESEKSPKIKYSSLSLATQEVIDTACHVHMPCNQTALAEEFGSMDNCYSQIMKDNEKARDLGIDNFITEGTFDYILNGMQNIEFPFGYLEQIRKLKPNDYVKAGVYYERQDDNMVAEEVGRALVDGMWLASNLDLYVARCIGKESVAEFKTRNDETIEKSVESVLSGSLYNHDGSFKIVTDEEIDKIFNEYKRDILPLVRVYNNPLEMPNKNDIDFKTHENRKWVVEEACSSITNKFRDDFFDNKKLGNWRLKSINVFKKKEEKPKVKNIIIEQSQGKSRQR